MTGLLIPLSVVTHIGTLQVSLAWVQSLTRSAE